MKNWILIGVLMGVFFIPNAAALGAFANHDFNISISVTPDITTWNTAIPIQINSSHIDFSQLNSPNGEELRFSNGTGAQEYDYFIETFNTTTEQIFVWVELPNMYAGVEQQVYMMYGNNSVVVKKSSGQATFPVFINDSNTTWDGGGGTVQQWAEEESGVKYLKINESSGDDGVDTLSFHQVGDRNTGNGAMIIMRTRFMDAKIGTVDAAMLQFEGAGWIMGLRIVNGRIVDSNCGYGASEGNQTYYCSNLSASNSGYRLRSGDIKGKWFRDVFYLNYSSDTVTADVLNGDFTFNSSNVTTAIHPNNYNISRLQAGSTSIGFEMELHVEYLAVTNLTRPVVDVPESRYLVECGEASTTVAFNFTVYNEENLTEAVRSDFEANFDMIDGSGVADNISFYVRNSSSFAVCVYPATENYTIQNAIIKYYNVSDENDYSTRYYFFQNYPADNITNEIDLYLLPEYLSNDKTFIVKNQYHAYQQDVLVKLARYFPVIDEYVVVAMGKTGYDGAATVPLKLSEYYRLIVERAGEILITTPSKQIVNTEEEELFITPGELIEFFDYWNHVAYSCIYTNSTTLIVCTVVDSSGLMEEIRLVAEVKKAFNYTEEVCSDTSTLSTATLVCNISGHNNMTDIHYYLRGTFTGETTTYYTLVSEWLDFSPQLIQWGVTGIFAGFMILMVLMFIGKWNPAVMVAFSFLSMVVGFVLGIPAVGWSAVLGLGIAAAILIYKVRNP